MKQLVERKTAKHQNMTQRDDPTSIIEVPEKNSKKLDLLVLQNL